MTNGLLSEATVNAIADLGSDGVQFEEDVRPALAAAGITEVRGESVVGGSAHSVWLFPSTTRDDIRASLSALDLTDPDSVEKVLRFTARLADVYAASNDADRVKIVRLRNALADDGYDLKMENGSMAGFSINEREIALVMEKIQQEFDKHPISVPVNADPNVIYPRSTTIYNGPVVHGDVTGAQLARGQPHRESDPARPDRTCHIRFRSYRASSGQDPGKLHEVGLPEDDRQDAETVANEALAEVTQAQPDRGKLRRALNALKGYLAPVAFGLVTGSAEGANEWARTAIEQLGTPF